MKYANSIIETIGNTPLIKLNHITSEIEALVLAKVESFNPGNSVKDRMALKMVEDAEAAGLYPEDLPQKHHNIDLHLNLSLCC